MTHRAWKRNWRQQETVKRICTIFSVSIHLSSSSSIPILIKYFLLLFTNVPKVFGSDVFSICSGAKIWSLAICYILVTTPLQQPSEGTEGLGCVMQRWYFVVLCVHLYLCTSRRARWCLSPKHGKKNVFPQRDLPNVLVNS